jgi:hypothetical protein
MLTKPVFNNDYKVISTHEVAEVRLNFSNNQHALHALKPFKKGDVISRFKAAAILKEPTYLTVQRSDNEHIHLSPDFLKYCNHSCNPSVFFDTASLEVMAVKDLAVGDELVFFYPSAEWDMAQPFDCFCGSYNCLHTIKGAKYLPASTMQQYRVTSFIQEKINQHQ